MSLRGIFNHYNIKLDIQQKIYSLIKDKENYDNVMMQLINKGCYNKVIKELSLRYNNGLWWLNMPRVRFSWQMIFASNRYDMVYFLPKNKNKFLDYTHDQLIYYQAINHQFVTDEISWRYDDYDSYYDDYYTNSEDNYGNY